MEKITDKEQINSVVKKLKLYQSSPATYDGMNGLHEFGPYGTTIKVNMIAEMRRIFRQFGFWEVEGPSMSPEIVWKASGHTDKFADIVAISDNKTYRVDKVLEEEYAHLLITDFSLEGLKRTLEQHQIIPKGNKEALHSISEYNLMVTTELAGQKAIMRPETATMTYLMFKDSYSLLRNTLPLKLFQFGKAYRNEITSRQGLMRGREFEQFEGQIFLTEQQKKSSKDFETVKHLSLNFFDSNSQAQGAAPVTLSLEEAVAEGVLQDEYYAYCFGVVKSLLDAFGFENQSIRVRQHLPTEMAHYAADAWDLEVYMEQYGWTEIFGLHDRGKYDLQQHQDYSGKNMTVKNEDGDDEVPTILEIALGVGRTLYAIIEKGLHLRDGKNVMLLPKRLAPIHVAVLPLVKKDGLLEMALELNAEFQSADILSIVDEKGSIGKRYARMDEIGTPYCITIDYDSKEEHSVTLRHIETGQQERVKTSEIAQRVQHIR